VLPDKRIPAREQRNSPTYAKRIYYQEGYQMKILKYTFLISAIVFILLQITYYPQMPDNVAIHFNTKGEVNGWMQKNTNLVFSCIFIIFITSTIYGAPYLVRHMSPGLFSLPNKEYWLSADNKERLIMILSKYLYSIGLATNIFMIYIFDQIYRFNIHAIDNVSIITIVPFIIIILGALIPLIIQLHKREPL
jgi:uncharacterized membrane protein